MKSRKNNKEMSLVRVRVTARLCKETPSTIHLKIFEMKKKIQRRKTDWVYIPVYFSGMKIVPELCFVFN